MDQQWIQTIVLALVGALVALASKINAKKRDDSPAPAPTKDEIKGVMETAIKDVLPGILEGCLPSYHKEADCATKIRAHLDQQILDRLKKIDKTTADTRMRAYGIQKQLSGDRVTHPVILTDGGDEP